MQQQREELKKELHEVSTQKKKVVSLQLEQVEHIQTQLESMKELYDAVKCGSDQEALIMKKQVAEDVKRVTDCYKTLNTEPVELVTMQFIPAEDYQNLIPQFANVIYGDADPLSMVAENLPSFAYVNRDVKFTITTKNVQGNICSNGSNKVIAQAQSSSTEGGIPVVIKDNKDGSYSASFVAKQTGEVTLSVIISGKHIKGSPYSISVQNRNYHSLNVPSNIVDNGGTMGTPWGIAFGKDGMWAVADHSNHCVYIFDSHDQLVRQFGSKGNGNGEFDSPAGLAFDDDNCLYVVCRYNHRVQKFTISGEYLLQFGNRGKAIGELDSPLGITVHNKRVYVADQVNHRISVFHCDGKFSNNIGSNQLNTTFDLTINARNQLLVADRRNHCIFIFTLDGDCVGKIGTKGSDKGQLDRPSGVAVDKEGYIFVTERGNYRVSVFDEDNTFKCCFGSKGSDKGQFNTCDGLGIAVGPDGSVYISDYSNKRIQIYSDF